MLEVRIGTGSDDAFARMLGITADLDVQVIWPPVVREIIHPFTLQAAAVNIDRAGELAGESWDYSTEPLYAASKARRVGHKRMMRWDSPQNERLYPSLTQADHPEHYFRLSNSSVSIGSLVPWAHTLTVGGINPQGEHYPGRTLLGWSGATSKRLVTQIQRAIKDKLEGRQSKIGHKRFNL